MVIILLILGSALYAGIRLVPVYLDYMKVARALEQVRDEYSAVDTNSQMIRRSLEKRWDVEDITGMAWQDVKITKTSEGFEVHAAYAVERPFVANVYLLTKFDKLVTVQQ
jgi:hypothetical protein